MESGDTDSAGVVPVATATTESAASSTTPLADPSLSSDKDLANKPGDGKDNSLPPPPAPPAGSPPADEPPSPAVAALRWFYERLTLTDSDRAKLWRKRGLTDDTIDALGYRSNQKTNRQLLLEMEQHFAPQVLLDCGLWKHASGKDGGEDFSKPPAPNAQYYGMGLVPKRGKDGKKVRDEDGNAIIEPVWGEADCPLCRKEWGCPDHPGPVLIPYFDANGDLIHLRPHKGMMKDRQPRFYIARPSRDWLAQHPESKLRAHGVGAVPGITMAKLLLPDIEEWLEDLTANQVVITEGEFKAGALYQELDELPTGTLARSVVVVYDNEDKRNPNLPGYQDEEWKQLEVEVWARFLANLIQREGYEASVGHLPDAWREPATGKADWDGYLSACLHQNQVTDYEGWKKLHPKIRAEFLQVLKKAVPVRMLWQGGLFDSKENRLIQNRLERLSYERQLPVGGDDEETIVRRLRRLIARMRRNESLPREALGYLSLVAQAYQATKGGYYIFKKLTDKKRAEWEGHLEKAKRSGDTDLKRVCELLLYAGPEKQGGLPQRITDFYMKAHYCILKMTGKRIRLVSLHNIHGIHTKTVQLPSEEFAQPSKFREWLLNSISGGTWRAGERELQAMQEDLGRDLARKEIEEVTLRGYHAESKCWFFGDVVYLPDGREIFADRDGIVAVRKGGEMTELYTLSEQDHENQAFCQGTPKMHPRTACSDEELKAFFKEAADKFYLTQGSHAAWLSMGAVLSCFAGPEIFKEWNAATGLWIHGQAREGKSCFSRWLLRMLGFNIEKGMPLADSTKVGISIAVQQYGESMVWLEEFQPGAPTWLIEKLKNIYDRGSGIKKTYDEDRRVIRANAIITGIATSNNGQLKSRYIHVQVAKKNRKEQTFDWMQKNSPRFYLFGRHCLRHRPKFAELVIKYLREFVEDEGITGMDERSRIVHGAALAAFLAFNDLVGQPYDGKAIGQMLAFTVRHAQENEKAVNDRMNITEFWRDVLDALGSDAFGETPEERRHIFKAVEVDTAPDLLTPRQIQIAAEHRGVDGNFPYRHRSYLLYIRPSELLDRLKRHKRMRGDDAPLDQADLLNHMRVQAYWHPSKDARRGHQVRFARERQLRSCWCIRVDDHDLGYQPHTDEEFEASLHPRDAQGNPIPDEWIKESEWIDPRKGELHALIDALRSQKEKDPTMIGQNEFEG